MIERRSKPRPDFTEALERYLFRSRVRIALILAGLVDDQDFVDE